MLSVLPALSTYTLGVNGPLSWRFAAHRKRLRVVVHKHDAARRFKS